MQSSTPLSSTVNFQLAVPHLLAPVAPSLAALHATRARRLYPSDPLFSGTHCVKCGTPFIVSDGQTRSTRKRRHTTKSSDGTIVRAVRRSCRSCGHEEDVHLGAACAPAFPKPRDRARYRASTNPHLSGVAERSSAGMNVPRPVSIPRLSWPLASSSTQVSFREGSTPSAQPTPNPSSAAHPLATSRNKSTAQDQIKAKARQKKRSGLQNMLVRNRERQEQEKRRDGAQGVGLSAFLQGLG